MQLLPALGSAVAAQMRGEASPADKLDKAKVMARLQAFIKQLDAVLPYLSLAVSAVGLLNTGRHTPGALQTSSGL